MPSFNLIPATLDLAFVRGDELPFVVQFPGRDLGSYTITAGLYNASGSADTVLVTPTLEKTVTTVNGQPLTAISVLFVETQTASLSIFGRYRWWLRWVTPGGVTRTLIAGNAVARDP